MAPPGRTHLYYTGTPEFAFGTGLSYSEFSLEMVESVSAAAVDMAAQTQLEYKLKLSHRAGPPGKRTILAFWKKFSRNFHARESHFVSCFTSLTIDNLETL